MELQWPLIIFTTLVAWSAGVFGTQALLAWGGNAKKAQMPAWITAAVLLVVGGISVFFHLEHADRIFNGFGHLTSGITQELIMIVIVAVIAVIYLVLMRKSEDGASVPKWLCALAVVACVALVCIMASSYVMAARPAWNSFAWVLYVLGNACILGPATVAAIMALKGDELAPVGMPALIGALIGLVTAAAYAVVLQLSTSAFASVGFYFDPTHPTKDMVNASGAIASQSVMVWVVAVVLGALVPAILAFVAKKNGNWKVFGALAVVCALVGAVAMRVAFYNAGLSVFMFY